jgi:hypothetical protein
MHEELKVRPIEQGDLQRLADFHHEAYGVASTPELWNWKYFQNPAGKHFMVIALDGERIVARMGGVPYAMVFDDEEMVFLQALDINILPSYRDGGTFVSLTVTVRELISTQFGPDIAEFGFGNKRVCDAATRWISFSPPTQVSYLVKMIAPGAYLHDRLRLPRLSRQPIEGETSLPDFPAERSEEGFSFREINEFDKRFDDLWERCIRERIMVIRNQRYLQWRYAQCPTGRYRIIVAERDGRLEACLVIQPRTRKGAVRVQIVDFFSSEEGIGALLPLLKTVTRWLKGTSVVSINCWMPQHSPYYPIFKKCDFRDRVSNNYLITKYSGQPDKNPSLAEALPNEKNWFYTQGDSDYQLLPHQE